MRTRICLAIGLSWWLGLGGLFFEPAHGLDEYGEDVSVDAADADDAAGNGAPDETEDFPKPFVDAPPVLDATQAKFLRERAEAGDGAMQCLYGLALLNGSAGHRDAGEAGRWLKASAEGGDGRGGFEYGKYLYLGLGGREDAAASLEWLKSAAERGVMEAAYYLGAALLAGEGVGHDSEEGERWLRRAAVSGLAAAQSDLGIAYYSGVGGVRQDHREARRWLTLAAKQGNGDACNKLGVMYRNGAGVAADPERAILWFSLGANLGDPFAQFNLANSYLHGEWVARDVGKAARWHEASGARGNAESQYLMGCFYAEGLGVRKDLGRAREWLALAERGGHAKAGELLERLWEMDDDAEIPPRPAEPARVDAAELLRGFSLSPLRAVGKGRRVLLRLGDEVDVSPGGEPGRYYVTVPGYPGVVSCEAAEGGDGLRPGMVVWGVGQGFSGLDGFLRLGGVRPATEEELGKGNGLRPPAGETGAASAPETVGDEIAGKKDAAE